MAITTDSHLTDAEFCDQTEVTLRRLNFESAHRAANVAALAFFQETDPGLKRLREAEWQAAARRLKWAGEDLVR